MSNAPWLLLAVRASYPKDTAVPRNMFAVSWKSPPNPMERFEDCPLLAGVHQFQIYLFADKIRNMKNETEQLKIIPDPRPGSFKETHLFRRIDGDSFESYLTTTTAAPKTTTERDRGSRDEARDRNTLSSSSERSSFNDKQVSVISEANLVKSPPHNIFGRR